MEVKMKPFELSQMVSVWQPDVITYEEKGRKLAAFLLKAVKLESCEDSLK